MGGNKRKKTKKAVQEGRELIFKEEMQEYAQTVKLFGDSRMEVQCLDGVKRIGHIRGKMRKKMWIANGDVVLVSLREYEKDKCDIIHKYNEEEVRKLKQLKEIPETIKLPEKDDKQEEDYNDIQFGDSDDENAGSNEENNISSKNKKNAKKDLPSSDSEESEDGIDVDKI